MTITAPPPNFKRTSENTTEADLQAAHEVRRLSKLEAAGGRGFDWEDECRELAALSFGVSGARSGGLVEPLDLSSSWERRIDFMEAEDDSGFDRDGVVR